MNNFVLDRHEKLIIAIVAFTCFAIHMITSLSGAYGFFRDELYYIACSDHLAWGYVDQPPFSLYVLKLSRLLLGDSLTAIRFVPSLAHTATVVMAGLIAKQMGGKSYAIFIACLGVFASLIHVGMCLIFSMNAIDILIWSLAVFLVLKIINTQKNSYWLWLGLLLGIGLLNKISVLFLGAGIFVGLIFTDRQWFGTRWPYLAGAMAGLIFLPYIIWNIANDFAHLEFIENASAGKYSGRSRMDFVSEQILLPNPMSIFLWITGLIALFFYAPLKKFRMLGWIFLTAFLILFLNRTSKGEYLAPGYAWLFAAGGVFIEQKIRFVWLRIVYPALIMITLALVSPMLIPFLSVENFVSYSKVIGIKPPSSENKALSDLPQFYADMFGWKEKARDVAKVYSTLNDKEKAACAILSNNYGRCGAIDFFGEAYGLPKSIGGHNNYWIWGPREYTGEVMIILGGELEEHVDDFETVELAGISSCVHCMPYENDVKIFLGRGLKKSLREIWPDEKHYE